MTKLEHALDAARRGLPVFPQIGKVPKIKQWPLNASAKESVITRWWTRWPDADIGIALPADVYVLDTDSDDALTAATDLRLPRTLTVKTARGSHYYFHVPFPLARMTGGGAGLRAIEGKGTPGPVTWAGSVHPSGHVYEIEVDAPIATMPGALVREIGPKRNQQRVGEATRDERTAWSFLYARVVRRAEDGSMMPRELLIDARADRALVLRALRCELPDMPTGWADRFFRAGAYLGPHVAAGAYDLDTAIQELTAVFNDLDTQGGDPGHVLRSIERGLATGARASERTSL